MYIINAINERIVTAVAHSKPITAEENQIYVSIFVDRFPGDLEDVVQLQWEPTDAEKEYDNN